MGALVYNAYRGNFFCSKVTASSQRVRRSTLRVQPISTFLGRLVENHLKMAVDSQCLSGMC